MQCYRAIGGTLLAGTDMQFGGIMLHRELRNLELLGMSPLEVIATASSVNAKAVGLENVSGVVRAGLRADLAILNNNPLADLSALRDIDTVLKAGEIVVKDGVFTKPNKRAHS